MTFGQMSVGQMSVGQMSVSQMSVGQMSFGQKTWTSFANILKRMSFKGSELSSCTSLRILNYKQSDQKFEKNRPIFGNVAKTVAKLQKVKLKVENSCIKLLLNVKISITNCVLKLLIYVKF
jgi:hypothetical protein